jgi:hypothetical protein
MPADTAVRRLRTLEERRRVLVLQSGRRGTLLRARKLRRHSVTLAGRTERALLAALTDLGVRFMVVGLTAAWLGCCGGAGDAVADAIGD